MSFGWAVALFLVCLFLLVLMRMKPGRKHPTGYVEDDTPVPKNDRMGFGGWERREAIDHPEDLKNIHKTKDRLDQ